MPPQHKHTTQLSLTQLCDLMEQSDVEETLDLGSTILHVVQHVHKGKVLLVSTACGLAALVTL